MPKNQFKKIQSFIKENEISYIDFRFTDSRGRLSHITYDAQKINADFFQEGFAVQGAFFSGCRESEELSVLLKPDSESFFIDPFTLHNTACIFCDVIDSGGSNGEEKDSRSTAERAQQYLKATGIGDVSYFGCESEFFIFDSTDIKISENRTSYRLDSKEFLSDSSADINGSSIFNLGSYLSERGCYCTQPLDSLHEIRTEIFERLKETGISPVYHHHEVAPGQCKIGVEHSPLKQAADFFQIYKYVVHNVASEHEKTATFMPKPLSGNCSSGMHCHQSLWKNGKNIFAGDEYCGLSQECLWYIGGIIKHARAINALSNPTPNSYKRFAIKDFKIPVHLIYSSCNRSASVRIPKSSCENSKRIECSFPDSSSNPYYSFTAMLMAGLDGIKNKINPGDPRDKSICLKKDREIKSVPEVAKSLQEALEALSGDFSFLTEGGVFTEDQISSYIKSKMKEVRKLESGVHPIELINYYSL